MEPLKKVFRRKGIDYRMIDRNDTTVMFEQSMDGEIVGYEVCKIQFNEAHVISGVSISASESVPSDEAFGYEGSKQFFPADVSRAKLYFRELTEKLTDKILSQ